MYEFFFDFEGNTSKNKHKLEHILLPEQSKPRVHKIGFVLYKFINLNLEDKEEIDNFITEWKVKKIRTRNGEEHNIKGSSDEKSLDRVRHEQQLIKHNISLCLSNESDIYLEPLSNEEKATLYWNEDFLNIPLTLTINKIFTKSNRTKRRYNSYYKKIKKELENIEQNINELEEEKRLFEKNTTGINISKDNKAEKVYLEYDKKSPEENEEKINEFEKEINELIDKRNEKVGLLRKEKTRGWEIGVKYKVEDIISLCWLEMLQAIQHNLPAKRCSLCSKVFIVYGKNNITRCPKCGKNDKTARQAHYHLNKQLDKINNNETSVETISNQENWPINWIKEKLEEYKN